MANRTCERRIEAIAALRRLRFTGPQIAELLGMALSTVSGILTRIGMGRLGRLGLEPAARYERERPGELVHIDVKKLGRIIVPGHRITGNRRQAGRRTTYTPDGRRIGDAGWEYVHIAIDDATRLAYAEVLPDEKASTAIAFLRRAIAFYARHGISVERVMTDNGSAYRSAVHALACRALGIRHLRTRPRRPQTNGKAERFIAPCSPAGPTARSTATAENELECPRFDGHLSAGSVGARPEDVHRVWEQQGAAAVSAGVQA